MQVSLIAGQVFANAEKVNVIYAVYDSLVIM